MNIWEMIYKIVFFFAVCYFCVEIDKAFPQVFRIVAFLYIGWHMSEWSDCLLYKYKQAKEK